MTDVQVWAAKILPVVQAAAEGKVIEFEAYEGVWRESSSLRLTSRINYRIKPEPESESIVYTYTPDMTRPLCPDCGCEVYQDINEPAVEWVGVCARGHKHTYQLDEDQE